MGDGGPVSERKKQNPSFVQVANLHFVEREGYRLKVRPFGPGKKYRNGVAPGLRALDADELKPAIAPSLAAALKAAESGTQLQRAENRRRAISEYLEEHQVRDSWVYAYSSQGGSRKFRYELRFDAAGKVKHLTAQKFAEIRTDAEDLDNDKDEDYEARDEWKGGDADFFEQVLPFDAKKGRVRWFFFGSPMRLAKTFVDELEGDDDLWAPEPGIDLLGKTALRVGEDEVIDGPTAKGTRFGVLVEVFNPMTVVRNAAKDYQAKAQRNVAYLSPHQGMAAADAQRLKRRTLAASIAESLDLLKKAGGSDPGDVDAMLADSARFATMKGEFFSKRDIERADALDLPIGTRKAWEQFRATHTALKELNALELSTAGVILMLLLTSEPWGMMERVSQSSDARAIRDGYRFLEDCSAAYSLLGDTNSGAKFMFDLCDHIEQPFAQSSVPGVRTMKLYVMRDPSAPKIGDAAKTAFKAGTAPIGLWSKLVSFYSAKNAEFLNGIIARSGLDTTSEEVQKLVSGLTGQQRVLATSAFTMQMNLSRVYEVLDGSEPIPKLFGMKLEHTVVTGAKTAVFVVDDDIFPLGRTVTFDLTIDDGFADRIDELREEVLNDPFKRPTHPLTFENLSNLTGTISLAFSVRSLAIALEDGAPSGTVLKGGFDVFKSVYGIPWVQKRLGKVLKPVVLKAFSEEFATKVIAKGVPVLNLVIATISMGFTGTDFFDKLDDANNDDQTVAGLSMATEVLGLLSAMATLVAPPVGIALAIGAAVVSGAQLLYTLNRPEDDAALANLCLFGQGFRQTTSAPQTDARNWMSCPNFDARFFNPAFTAQRPGGELEALQRQLAAFTTFLCNFNVEIKLGEKPEDARVGMMVINPGWLPRASFFRVTLEVRWAISSTAGTFEDGDTWGQTFTFDYYPDVDTAPPLAPTQPPNQHLLNLRSRGIVGLGGGPLFLEAQPSDTKLELQYWVEAGAAPARVEGVFSGDFRDGSVGMRFRRKARVRYRVQNERIVKNGRFVQKIDIDLSNQTEDDFVPSHIAFVVEVETNEDGAVARRDVPGEAEPVETNPQARKYEVELDLGPSSEPMISRLQGFALEFRDGLGETIPGQPVPTPGGNDVIVDLNLKYDTQNRYRFEIPYEATLAHTGDIFTVEVVHELATLIALDDDNRRLRDVDVELNTLSMEYVRNEGQGAPLEQGSRDNLFSLLLLRKSGAERTFLGFTRNAEPEEGPDGSLVDNSIRVDDALLFRFGVEANLDGVGRNSLEPFHPVLNIQWAFADSTKALQAPRSKIVEFTKVSIHCVLDGEENGAKFIPSRSLEVGPAQPKDLVVDIDVPRVQMNGDLTGYLVNPDTESNSAMSACSCLPESS